MGDRDEPLMNRQIGEAQSWKAALPGAQHLAGAA